MMKCRSIVCGILISCAILLIFRFSLQDAPTSNTLSKQVTQSVTTVLEQTGLSGSMKTPTNSEIRALAHFGLFFLLGLISMGSFLFQKISLRRATCVTLILGMITALVDEIIQLSSDGRAFEWIDMGKDVLGVCVSIILISILVLIYRATKKAVEAF